MHIMAVYQKKEPAVQQKNAGVMMDFSLSYDILPAAFLLDLLIGDPRFAHHPVRYMGKSIEAAEPFFRRLPVNAKISGGLFALCLIPAVWLITALILTVSAGIHPLFNKGLEILLVYFCISCRGLESAAMEIHGILRRDSLQKAREKLAMIVGRDVRHLSEKAVARASVETVAENLVDGVISPLFFLLIGGIPLMMTYKMVNTLDSMVGYKNEKYRDFGMISARTDDIANYLPARISLIFISLAAQILKRKGKQTFEKGRKEGRKHASPNAGFPEAAFAGALEIKLGGPNIYHGKMVDKPFIGENYREVRVRDIPRACDLMLLSSLLFCLAVWGTAFFI